MMNLITGVHGPQISFVQIFNDLDLPPGLAHDDQLLVATDSIHFSPLSTLLKFFFATIISVFNNISFFSPLFIP